MSTRCEKLTFTGSGIQLVADTWTPIDSSAAKGTVLLLHGGGQTRNSWKHTGQRLAQRGWTAIAVDARGHGDSGWAEDGDYSLDAMVSDLIRIVGSLPDTPIIVGASMGGMSALIGEGENRNLARALVLVDIAPTISTKGVDKIIEFMTSSPNGFDSLADAANKVEAYNPQRKSSKSVDGLKKNLRLGPDNRWRWHWDPAFVTYVARTYNEQWPERAKKAASNITVPTLLIRGQFSDVLTDDSVQEFCSLIPGARYLNLQGTGHMVVGDDNDAFGEAMIGFVEGV